MIDHTSAVIGLVAKINPVPVTVLRVRLTGFGDYYLEIEIFAYALTNEYPKFLEIREEVLLEAMAIVENAGTRLALPTEIHYEGGQAASVGRSETTT